MRQPLHLSASDAFIGEEILDVTHPADSSDGYRLSILETWVGELRSGVRPTLAALDLRAGVIEQQMATEQSAIQSLTAALGEMTTLADSREQTRIAEAKDSAGQLAQLARDIETRMARLAEQQDVLARRAAASIADLTAMTATLVERLQVLENTRWRRLIRWIRSLF